MNLLERYKNWKSKREAEKERKRIIDLFYLLYDMYPNSRLQGHFVKEVIHTDKDISELEKGGLLIKEKFYNSETKKEINYYGLGPNGLMLISMWNTEKLTKWVIGLTVIVAVLTFVSIIKCV